MLLSLTRRLASMLGRVVDGLLQRPPECEVVTMIDALFSEWEKLSEQEKLVVVEAWCTGARAAGVTAEQAAEGLKRLVRATRAVEGKPV